MKNQDILREFHALRSALLSEGEAIQKRLQQINAALGGTTELAVAPITKKRGRPPGKRPENAMSLRESVLQVLTATPIAKQELLEKVQKIGYRFSSSDPMNSLQ